MELEDFLKHYGVRGMKWGVRKNRSSKGRSGLTTFNKNPNRLSDEELNRRIKRMELEKKYTDLNAPIKSNGEKYVKTLLESSGKGAVGAVIGTSVTFLVGRALKKKFPDKKVPAIGD